MTHFEPTHKKRNYPHGLSDVAIRGLKPRDKPYKTFDVQCRGLFIVTNPTGSKLWRFRYWIKSRSKVLALGAYPAVSLSQARQRVQDARTALANSVDPGAERRKAKAAESATGCTFEAVAREWLSKHEANWAPKYTANIRGSLERDVFPWIGSHPIADVTSPELLTVIRRIESRGAVDTSHRVLRDCGAVFRYGVATGRCDRDPSADLRGALATVKVRHHPAITQPVEIGGLLRAIDSYSGSFVVRVALRLSPLVFCRPGELRRAEWSEVDFGNAGATLNGAKSTSATFGNDGNAEWRIPGSKMKTGNEHIVPLSHQTVALLRELHPLTGHGRYLFPSERTVERPMSENTINGALRRLGYSKDEMTGHGFRAMASTILNERGYPADIIERQLAHSEKNKVRAAYNRAEYLDERRAMMQAWADYLDQLRDGGQVIAFPARGIA